MSLGVLSDCYLALNEIKKHGPITLDIKLTWDEWYRTFEYQEVEKFKYLNLLLKFGELYKLEKYVSGSYKTLIQTKYRGIEAPISDPVFEITTEGKKYIEEDIKKRKTRFHIKSWCYCRAFLNILINNKDGYSDFEREIALTHNGILNNNKLTRQGEKFLTTHLGPWLDRNLNNLIWNPEIGPNKALYTAKKENDFGDWKTTLEYDFKLANCVPGIAPLVIPLLESNKRDYASILFLSSSVEEVIEKIKQKQKENPDQYIFCD